MTQENPFKEIVALFKKSQLSDEDGYLVAHIPASIDFNDDIIKGYFKDCGYKNLPDYIVHKEDGSSTIHISRSAAHWGSGENGISPFHMTHRSFWQQIANSESIPHLFFIQEDKISSCDEPSTDTVRAYNLFFAFKKLIFTVADHIQNENAVIFITSDTGLSKFEISTSVDFKELQKITNPTNKLEEIIKLQNLLNIDDPHKKERISVMRSSIAEFINITLNKTNIFLDLIKKSSLLPSKYDDLYDIYMRRFSVNKILNELDEKSIEFTSKINEFISSSQTKAITMPGALIAVGALAKVGGVLEAALILGGLWMIRIVTISANDIYRESLDTLNHRIVNAFKKYLKFDEGKEVKENAVEIEADLKRKIVKAKERLDNIDILSTVMFLSGFFYLIIHLMFPAISK